jgi:hypothetical protein
MLRFPWLRLTGDRTVDASRSRRLGRLLAAACLLMVFGPPLFMAGFLALADTKSIAFSLNLSPGIIEGDLVTWQRVAGIFVMEIPVLFISFGMWRARECFLDFANGTMFTSSAVRSLRRFAGWMLAATVAELLILPVMSVLLTAHNVGEKTLALRVDSDQLLMLPRIAMMWLLAAVVGERQRAETAQRLREAESALQSVFSRHEAASSPDPAAPDVQ